MIIFGILADSEVEQQQAPTKKKGRGASKREWTFPDAVEEDLVLWLKENPYLWERGRRAYHLKKKGWEDKARELDTDYDHLSNWWKNLRDWYVD